MTNDSDPLNLMPALGQEQVNIVPPVAFMGEVSVESRLAEGIIEAALTQVKDNLTDFAASPTFETDILTVFGDSANVDLGETIIDALAVGEDLPQIIVVPVEQMNGASGGFDSLTGTVYLADSLIDGSSLLVADVLVEELGHYVDSRLNLTDTPGDEGEHFAALVGGEVLSWEDVGRLRGEDDRVEILNGAVVVEADDSFETAIDLGAIAQEPTIVVDDVGFATGLLNRDTKDFYRFQVDSEGLLVVFLDNLFQDADIDLYGSGEELINQSRNDGTQAERIETVLDPGTYYARVDPQGSDRTPYRLSLNFISLAASEISISDSQIIEGNQGRTNAQFAVTLNDATPETVTVNYTTANQTAKANEDYGSTKGTLTFSPGQVVKTIEVPIFGDSKVEPDETFQLQLSNPTNAQLKDELGIATIANDDIGGIDNDDDKPQPKIFIGDARITEGNRGRKNAKFQITLDAKPDETVTVNYATANQTAKANQDYKPTQGTLTFQPGETKKTITVPILGDNKVEPKETFQLKLSNPNNAELKDQLGIGTITNDDKPQPKISVGDARITEGNRGRKNAKFQITLDAKPDETVRVDYATANQTAKANQDYKATKGTLTFKPGQTRKTITVPIFGDNKVESNETFNLNLSRPRNAQLKDRRGIGTIRDNDFAQLSIKDTQITEGDSGQKQLKFDVALNAKVNQRVQVNYATADGTAEQGSDYQQTQGKLTFKPNQQQQTITVPILGDTFNEDDETFTVELSKPSKGVKLGDKRAIGTIKDNGDKDEADGDTFETAIDFGKLLEKEVISDDIGATIGLDRDTDDYYRFQVSHEGTLRVFLDSLFEDANVELLGSGEELISQSDNEEISEEEIIQSLDPGIYYVRVYPNSGDRTPYRLSLNFI